MSIVGPEELAQIGELRRYREQIERLTTQCNSLANELDARWRQVIEAAAFLDGLANRLDVVVQAGCIAEDDADQAAADCRAMAAKLRANPTTPQAPPPPAEHQPKS